MANFSVVNNIQALNAQNQLSRTQIGLSKAIGRLSSGLRINSAADDASGLTIAESLRADVSALNQAVRNANDGIGIISVADGALNEIANLFQRAVSLAEQAASDTSGDDNSTSKTALNDEYTEIRAEVDRIAATVEFNGKTLLTSGGATIDIQVGTGATANDRIQVTTTAVSSTSLGLTAGAFLTKAGAQSELANLQTAIDSISGNRGDLGAALNRLESTIAVVTTQAQNLASSESQIRDANVAEEVVNLTRFQVLNQTGLAALAQANATSSSVLALLG